jgi:hypothetical protein
MPNDHHVPRTYLRRFAIPRRDNPREWVIDFAEADNPTAIKHANIKKVAAEGNFYTFSDFDNQVSRDLETFFAELEGAATPVLRYLLDHPHYALPALWPLPPRLRGTFAWYLAAQIVRTTRQRKRLEAWGAAAAFMAPGALAPPDLATTHARYIASTLGNVASALYSRPWGVGFSSACLPTSDCPVVILNAHDDEDQAGAAATWDVLFPLDPHRFIFMPDIQMQEDDPEKRQDHRLNMDGVSLAFVDAIYAAAHRYLYMHPHHHPLLDRPRSPRLPAPGSDGFGVQSVLMYRVLPEDLTISARWVTSHPPPRGQEQTAPKGAAFGLR